VEMVWPMMLMMLLLEDPNDSTRVAANARVRRRVVNFVRPATNNTGISLDHRLFRSVLQSGKGLIGAMRLRLTHRGRHRHRALSREFTKKRSGVVSFAFHRPTPEEVKCSGFSLNKWIFRSRPHTVSKATLFIFLLFLGTGQ